MMIKDEEGEETQLHIAARLNNVELVRAALREGFDANAVGISGWTPVHEAASSGDCAVLRLLLRSGGDPNVQDRVEKCTSLHLAARNGHLDAVRLLVRNGARLDLKNAEKLTAQDVAEDDCLEYLDTKRLEGVVRQAPSDFRNSGEQSLQKLYKKTRQNSRSQHSTPESGSRDSLVDSSSLGESGSSGSDDQDPYDIGLSFDFNKKYLTLKIHIGHVKNLKLPAGHNYSHLYVKSYLIPCKNQRVTKRKTSELKIESLSSRQSSSSSSGAESVDSTDSGISLEERMTKMVIGSLKKRPSLSPKKKKRNKDNVKCMVQQDVLEGICRISAVFNEHLMYDTVTLSKVDLALCEIVITVCGRNSWTSSGQPIVSVRIPLSSAAEQVTHRDFPLEYHMTEQPSRGNTPEGLAQSCERPQGRRNFGWNEQDLSKSVPNLAPKLHSDKEPGFSYMASTNDVGGKKSKKRSPFKFFKSDLKLTKGSTNDRYKKASHRESSTTAGLNDSSSTEWNRSFGSSPPANTTTPSRLSNAADSKNGQDRLDCSDEVMAFHISQPSLTGRYRNGRNGGEDEVPRAHFMRYSRAFQQHSMKRDDSDAISVEDLDDSQSPFAIQEKPMNTRMAARTRINVA